MATTVGHALSGIDCLLVIKSLMPRLPIEITVKTIVAMMILANLPDLDMLFGVVLGEGHLSYHGKLSHTLFFNLCLGFALGLIVHRVLAERAAVSYGGGQVAGRASQRGPSWYGTTLLVTAPLCTHVLIDCVTGPQFGLSTSYGRPLLWPIVEQAVRSPVTLFVGPYHDKWSNFFSWHNVFVVSYELLFFGVITGLLLCRQYRLSGCIFYMK